MGIVALVTGANQGLGFALVKGLCRRLSVEDTVYLTARNETRGRQAAAALSGGVVTPTFWPLDVTDEGSVVATAEMLRERHGGVDIVISNAAARISKERSAAEQVRQFIETNNHGTRRIIGQLLPLVRDNGRFLVVASSFGTLRNLAPELHGRFDVEQMSLDGVESVMAAYASAVEAETAVAQGWPEWINIPSKIGQVASAKIAAREITERQAASGILVNAVCPGLVDTDASRPWFDDMSLAQSPDEAAEHVLWLATLPAGTDAPHGQLIQFRKPIPWR